jgi:hypothetical protein
LTKSEDKKSMDLNPPLVKNRITPRKRKGPQVVAGYSAAYGLDRQTVRVIR